MKLFLKILQIIFISCSVLFLLYLTIFIRFQNIQLTETQLFIKIIKENYIYIFLSLLCYISFMITQFIEKKLK